MLKPNLYLLTCLTDLHCGKDNENYEAIDQLIQRDSRTSLPCINGTSLHGALREYFFDLLIDNEEVIVDRDLLKQNIKYWLRVFGKESEIEANLFELSRLYNLGFTSEKIKKWHDCFPTGVIQVSTANLLSLSKAATDVQFVNITTKEIIKELEKEIEIYNINNEKLRQLLQSLNNESFELQIHALDNKNVGKIYNPEKAVSSSNFTNEATSIYLGDNPCICEVSLFKSMNSDLNLPTMVRNSTVNGISTNVWYEQFIPSQSRFYAYIFLPDDDLGQKFHEHLDGKYLNIGANGTVGMGKVLFTNISENVQ